jgi:transcriptional regulator with XRE-family HTH domain
MTSPRQRPEGKLIQAARELIGLSIPKAAERIGISDSRWRQIESGFISQGGRQVPVTGPRGTVARMAQALAVTPEQLDKAGRGDAAEVLRHRLAAGEDAAAAPDLPDDLPDDLPGMLEVIRTSPYPPEVRKRMAWQVLQMYRDAQTDQQQRKAG